MTKMKPEIKAEWISRLKDGREQAHGVLETVDPDGNVTGQCCLGVLTEMACEAGIVSREVAGGKVYYDGEPSVLPDKVVEWVGFPTGGDQMWNSRNPGIQRRTIDGNSASSIAEANDHGADFNLIAEIIEEEF